MQDGGMLLVRLFEFECCVFSCKYDSRLVCQVNNIFCGELSWVGIAVVEEQLGGGAQGIDGIFDRSRVVFGR